jgi:L-amino acid N-acyltransferase YncA
LMDRARDGGFREMIAVIGDADNVASIGLHLALGFEHAGMIRRVGYKFDRWLDVIYMQKRLIEDPV